MIVTCSGRTLMRASWSTMVGAQRRPDRRRGDRLADRGGGNAGVPQHVGVAVADQVAAADQIPSGPAGYSDVSEKKALKSVKVNWPQSSRHISTCGRRGRRLHRRQRRPAERRRPEPVSASFLSSSFLGRDIGGIVGEGQLPAGAERIEDRGEIGSAAKAHQPLGPATDRRRARSAPAASSRHRRKAPPRPGNGGRSPPARRGASPPPRPGRTGSARRG